MGRAPCCDKANVKKGPWSPEEDAKLKEYIEKFGTGGNWIALPQKVVSLSGHTGSSGGTFLQPQVTPQEQMSLLSCGSSEGSYTNIGWGVSASEQANSFLEYGLEDIKQLISSNSNINNFSLLEESKTQERVLYYY
ncbi:hypothetical protein TIFTF001_008456 [Ficus carica]|uniref:Uncharacterized protein n=1 Tax=Ficus carica TaxID=3494 RepID=A0AA88A8K2_FICCA|nr:hypothetical protein TIFTF001_008456 [Ficus carica]